MIGFWRAFRNRNPGASVPRLLLWEAICALLYPWLFLFHGFRAYHARNIPTHGPVLLLCNHQSYMDLLVLGPAIRHRHFHPMGRHTLFRGFLGMLIRNLNAIEINQGSERGDIRAIRSVVDRLQRGYLVLIFPEGTRSPDGYIQGFQPGVLLLIRRAKPTIVPAAIHGAFDAWPSGQKFHKPGPRVAVEFGKPIDSDSLLKLPPEHALALLRDTIESLRRGLEDRIARQSARPRS